MNVWLYATVISAKSVMHGLRLIGRSGTALPGYIVQHMYPSALKRLTRSLPMGVYLITGTNGKTTTSKILRSLLESRGYRVLSNRSGSNFTRGIISSLIEHCDWFGRLNRYDIAVFEVDEAYARIVARQIQPKAILVLNVMRDQLDRYGEIDTTARLIIEAIENSGGMILNKDDPSVAAMSRSVRSTKPTTTYGVSRDLQKLLPSDEQLLSAEYKKPTVHSTKAPDVVLTAWNMNNNELSVKIGTDTFVIRSQFEGVHNAQNITGALAFLYHVFGNVSPADCSAIETIKPAFGRGERVVIHGVTTHLALIKNPGGFNQNLRTFCRPNMGAVLILINDQYADGRDVSWLWDVSIGTLKELGPPAIVTGGSRAYDMALRLQYEGVETKTVQPLIKLALLEAVAMVPKGKDLLILPTYTAMLEVRKLLSKKTDIEAIWH